MTVNSSVTTEREPSRQTAPVYRWVILLVSVLCQMGLALPGQGIPSLAYFIQDDLSLSRAQIGMIGSALAFGALITFIGSGWLADRVAPRLLLLSGQVLTGVSVVLMAYASSFSTALLLLIPAGIGTALTSPAVSKGILYWFAPRARGTAMSIKQTGVPLGGAAAAAVLPTVALASGWRNAVAAIGLVVVSTGIVAYVLYREYREPEKKAAARQSLGLRQALKILTARDVLLASAVAVPLTAIQFAVVTYLLLYLNEVLLFPVVLAGMMLSVTQVAAIPGRITWGMASDYLMGGSRRRTLLLLTGLGTAAAIATILLPAGCPPIVVAVVAALLGFTGASWNGVFSAQVGELAGKEIAGLVTGFALTFTQIGLMFGPIAFGFVVDHTGSYHVAWVMTTVLWLVAACLLSVLHEPRHAA